MESSHFLLAKRIWGILIFEPVVYRHIHSEESHRTQDDNSYWPHPPLYKTVHHDIPDVIDTDRPMEKDHREEPRIIQRVHLFIYQDAMDTELRHAKEHLWQPQPDQCREDNWQNIKWVSDEHINE